MGKAKKKSRSSKSRANPISRNAVKDEQLRIKKVQPLLEKLKSIVPNDRTMALGSISALCEDPHMRDLFMKEKLVHLIMTRLLSDENTEIVVDSYGLLRNLCLEVGYDVCVHLWRSDIWTSINAGFDKLLKALPGLSQDAKAPSESWRLLFDFGDNLVSLAVALASDSEDIFSAMMEPVRLERLLAIAKAILKYGAPSAAEGAVTTLRTTTQLFNSTLDLVYTFAAESSAFIEAISKDEFLSSFLKVLPGLEITNGNNLTKILVQGIMIHMLDASMSYGQAVGILQNSLSAVNDIKLEDVKTNLDATRQNEAASTEDREEIMQELKHYDKKRNFAMMQYQSLVLFLDVVTAVMELVAAKFEEGEKNVPESLVHILTDVLPAGFENLSSEFSARLLIACNNWLWLMLTLNIDIFELPSKPCEKIWDIMNAADSSQLDIRVGKLKCLWALLKTSHTQYSSLQPLEALNLNTVPFAESLIQEFQKDESLDNDEKLELKQACCGALATLAQFQNQIEINRIIGVFFIRLLADRTLPAQLLVDVANHFIYTYPDASFDYDSPVFVKEGFLQALKEQVMPNLKAVFKLVDKNKDPQLKAECQERFITLDSFIHYKEKELM